MLTKTQFTETTTPITRLTGHELVILLHRLTPRQRAQLAKQMHLGGVQMAFFTREQAAVLCDVSLPLVHDAVTGKAASHVNGGTASRDVDTAKITAWWNTAPIDQRVDLIREIGVAPVWDILSTAIS